MTSPLWCGPGSSPETTQVGSGATPANATKMHGPAWSVRSDVLDDSVAARPTGGGTLACVPGLRRLASLVYLQPRGTRGLSGVARGRIRRRRKSAPERPRRMQRGCTDRRRRYVRTCSMERTGFVGRDVVRSVRRGRVDSLRSSICNPVPHPMGERPRFARHDSTPCHACGRRASIRGAISVADSVRAGRLRRPRAARGGRGDRNGGSSRSGVRPAAGRRWRGPPRSDACGRRRR